MMVCEICGTEFDNEQICPFCGWRADEETCTAEEFIAKNEAAHGEMKESVLSGRIWEKKERKLGMRWHKFTVYFSLWLSMLLNLYSIVLSFPWCVVRFGEDRKIIWSPLYTLIDYIIYKWKLNIFSVTFMCIYLALVVVAVVACIRLMKMKKGAHVWLNVYMVLNTVASFLFVVILSFIISRFVTIWIYVILIQGVVAFPVMIFDMIYYHKRKHLFNK